ncbi:putative serine/threonine-protein kinase 10, partial [Apostichopus japonicus]
MNFVFSFHHLELLLCHLCEALYRFCDISMYFFLNLVAKHKDNGTLAAAKIIEIKDEEELTEFRVEIDILSACQHKYIVGLLETYLYEDKLWMLIEFCEGGALDDIMLELEKPLMEPQIKVVCKQTLEALVFLHSSRVIH